MIDDESGVTALIHNVADGTPQNIIINNANGRDLVQQIEVTLELPGFQAVQHPFQQELFGPRIEADMHNAFAQID